MDNFPEEQNGKLNTQTTPEGFSDFEEELARRSEELVAKRRDYYRSKGDRKRSSQLRREKKKNYGSEKSKEETPDTHQTLLSWKNGRRMGRKGKELNTEQLTIYKAKAALVNRSEVELRSESFIHRTIRLVKALHKQRKFMKGKSYFSHERRRDAYRAIFYDCWEPICRTKDEMLDCLWNFLVQLGSDFMDCLLFIGDLIITAAYYLGSVALYLWDWLWDVRLWIDRHKRVLFGIFVGSVSCIAAGALVYSSIVAYEYSYYGKTLGVAKTKEDVYRIIDVLGDKLAEANDANITLDVERDIQFTPVYGFRMEVDSTEDILNNLTYMKDIQVRAYAISVNGEQLVIVESESIANSILDSIKSDFITYSDDVELKSIDFVEDIQIEEVGVLLGDIWNALEAKRYLATGTTKQIADTDLKHPFVNVVSTETLTFREDVDYGTKFINNSNLYSDEQILVSDGIKGVDELVALVSKYNGEETSREIIATTRVAEPVDEVKYQGTKAIPPSDGTGTFIYPVRSYTLTSYFGMRWGKMHNGIDLAAPTGTNIHATDGGTVTFAGWKPSYGYVVIIDHGGLYESVYAHCSQILVSAGEEVYQDKTIALVGSTGNSTGPHLHFEIHYKGVAENPLNYLP